MGGVIPTPPTCAPCAEFIAANGDEPLSLWCVNDHHWTHRPPHPSEVGKNHRKAARAEWDRWEESNPINAQLEPLGFRFGGGGGLDAAP